MSLKRPFNEQAERAVLGSALIDEGSVGYIVSCLSEEDFYISSLRYIFRAIAILKENRIPVDLTSVANKLNDLHLLETIGGVSELTSLVDGVVSENVRFYVEDLKDKTNLRRLADFLEKAYEDYEANSSIDIHKYMNEFEHQVLNITRNRETGDFKNLNQLASEYNSIVNSVETVRRNVSTGYAYLDTLLNGGFSNGDLIILAARPAMGKTALALNLAYKVAVKNHTPVAFFSLEMGGNQLLSRLISFAGTIKNNQVQQYQFKTEKDLVKLDGALNRLKDVPLFVDDTPGLKLVDFLAKCRKIKTELPSLGLIVVDYLQLIKCDAQSREQEVAKVARELKEIARELEVPVLALAQLNRRADAAVGRAESKVSKRPELSDLRESGQIEQDADVISFIYREAYYDATADQSKDQNVELIIRKNRNGSLGTVNLVFSPEYAKFTASFRADEQGSKEDNK